MFFPHTPQKIYLLLPFVMRMALAGDTAHPIADVLEKSRQLIETNRNLEAIAVLERNRIQVVRQHDERSEALVLDELGVAYMQQGEYLAARSALDASVSLLGRINGRDTFDLVQPLNHLANLLYESGQGSQAERLLRRSLKILDTSGPRNGDTGTELAILAKMYLSERKIRRAQQSAEESLKVLQEAGRSDDLTAALAWSVLGGVYDATRNINGAEESLERALSILKKDLNPENYHVGEGMANLGLFYANQGLTEKAETLLEQAHVSFRAQTVNTLFVRSFLMVWANIERKAGHIQKAEDLTDEAQTLMAANSEVAMSRFLFDASALR